MFFQRLVIILVISIASISSARAAFIDSFESGKYDESFRLAYSKALNGDASAQYVVGRILYEGLGSASRDVDLAKKFIDDSIDQGNGRAAKYIGEQLSKEGAEKSSRCKGLDYLKKAESLGERGLGKTILSLSKVCEGKFSKQACSRYNKNDKKLAATIARCIARGHIKGDAEYYWLISFKQGNIASLVEAADVYLDPKSSKLDPSKIVDDIPAFHQKASKKILKRFSQLVNAFGYSSASCKSGTDAFGFEKKGDTIGCVLAAAAGDSIACQTASIWWRNGEQGLRTNISYADFLSEKCVDRTDTNTFDLALYLKGLESNPKKHFEEAIRSFNQDSLLNGQIVGQALQLEMSLFITNQFAVFAKSSADIINLFQAIDWNGLDPQTIAEAQNLIDTKYANTPVFNDIIVMQNMDRLKFNREWASLLFSKNPKKARGLVNKFLIEGDCDAYNYSLENQDRADLALVTQEMMATCVRQMQQNPDGGGVDWQFNSAKAAALLSQKLRGPIDLQCPHFGEYLENRDKFNAANLAVVPDSVKDEANTIEICKDKDAKVARWESERLITDVWSKSRQKNTGWNSGNTYEKIVSEAFRLASISCSKDDGYGCGLAAFILMDFGKYTDEKPSGGMNADQQQNVGGYFVKKAKQLAVKGYSLESAEAGGVLLDLSNLNSSRKSNTTEQAKLLLEEMLSTDSDAARIRNASLCIDKGIFGGFEQGLGALLGNAVDCSLDCRDVSKILRKDSLDIMSRSRGEKLLGMAACK